MMVKKVGLLPYFKRFFRLILIRAERAMDSENYSSDGYK